LAPKSVTLNDLQWPIGYYFALFAEFGSSRGELRKSCWLAINRFSLRKVIKYIN